MKKSKGKIAFMTVAVVSAMMVLPGLYCKLKTVNYTVESAKIHSPVRIAVIADYHACNYGEGQKELIDAVVAQNPDVVLFAGDIFDVGMDNQHSRQLLSALSEKYKCFYVTGNHEYNLSDYEFKKSLQFVNECGISRLSGSCEVIDIGGQRINVCGINDAETNRKAYIDPENDSMDYYAQMYKAKNEAESGLFTILLAHRPEYYNYYLPIGFDLIVAGHAHGGQVRIPYLMNGLYAPDQGFFPKYAGGKYTFSNGTCMIVSRGLARESTHFPRIYNRPELVIIDLKGTTGK